MKNAITLQKAQEIQRTLAACGHLIELEMLTDCATIPEEDEEAEFIALATATHDTNGAEIPFFHRKLAAAALHWELAKSVLKAPLLDASTEEGNAALANGYAAHGAIDRKEECFLWVFLPLANS